MNAQEIFNKVVLHLRKQNAKALIPGTIFKQKCAYRSNDGKKCAIGCLIDDSEYSPEMEGYPVDFLFMKFPSLKEKFNVTVGFLAHLQAIHDCHDPANWEKEFKILAEEYNLEIPS